MERLGDESVGRATVSADADADRIVVAMAGEIDLSVVDDLRASILPSLDGGAVDVVLDLSDVGFLDSSGITLLLEIGRRARSIRLRGASSPVRLVIDATGLADWFPAES